MARFSFSNYRYEVLTDVAREELEKRIVTAIEELEVCEKTMVSRCYGDHWEVSEEGIHGDAILCDVIRMYEAYSRAMGKESDPTGYVVDDMVSLYCIRKHGSVKNMDDGKLSYYAKLSVILEDLVTGYWMDNYA